MATFRVILLMITLSFLLIACDNQTTQTTLSVGVSPGYPPFEYEENNGLVGFDIDLAHLIAKKIDRTPSIKKMEFSTLLPALQNDGLDLVISAISATEERKEVVDFSDPYHETAFAIVSRKERPVDTIETLQNATIGVQMGSIMLSYVNERLKPRSHNHVMVQSSALKLIDELNRSHVDAVVIETAQAIDFTLTHPNLVYHTTESTGAGYAIALKKNSPLTTEINAALQSLKKEGELKRLNQKWLGEKQ